LACANRAGTHGLDEQRLVVLADAGGIGREIGGGHALIEDRAACKLHARDRLKLGWRAVRRVTVTTRSQRGQVYAPLGRRRLIWLQHGPNHRLWRALDKTGYQERNCG